jgi:hypothetical protein
MSGRNKKEPGSVEQEESPRTVLESEKVLRMGGLVPLIFFLIDHHHSDSKEKARNAS